MPNMFNSPKTPNANQLFAAKNTAEELEVKPKKNNVAELVPMIDGLLQHYYQQYDLYYRKRIEVTGAGREKFVEMRAHVDHLLNDSHEEVDHRIACR